MMAMAANNPIWLRLLWVAAIFAVAFVIGFAVFATHPTPIVRNRALDMLGIRFDSEAEIGELQVSLLRGISVSGKRLVLRHHGRIDVPPLIEIKEFSGEMGWLSLVGKPWHLRRVELKGLTIHIPPKEKRVNDKQTKHRDIPAIVDKLVSDDGELDLIPSNPEKPSHQFLIHHLLMHSVGLGHSAPFKASLTNALPPREITTEGHFGPWQIEDPGQTPLGAKYTFKGADLGVFHGIAGTLSSVGKFGGVLNNIDVDGETTTPDFSLSIADHSLLLKTDFQATVDGITGDTLLHPVIGQFLNTILVCNGGVVKAFNRPGREIVLDVKTGHARLEDLLRLAVKSDRPPMTGAVRLTTQI
jgi:hypothetical protein